MQFVKEQLKIWNRDSFKNIFVKKLFLENNLASLNERVIEVGMDEMACAKEKELNSIYKEILAREEVFWRQKSRETWLRNGDQNMKFFHKSVKARHARNRIFFIFDGQGRLLTTADHINKEAVNFFKNMFLNNSIPLEGSLDLLDRILRILTEGHNSRLMLSVSKDEVRSTLFNLRGIKPRDQMVFQLSFFRSCGTLWVMICGKWWRNLGVVVLS